MSPLTFTAIDLDNADLRGAKFADMRGRIIAACNLANTDWSTAQVKGLHVHNCTGVTPRFIITCCWVCGRFTDEGMYREALATAFNTNLVRR